DPQIYGDLTVDAAPTLAFLEDLRGRTQAPVTVTHVVGKALAHAFVRNPDLNGHVTRGRFVRRESIDVFFIVSADAGAELSGVRVDGADRKGVAEIAEEVASRARRI